MLETKIKWPLFALRVGVFITMAVWVADKFLNPEHTASVWSRYYNIDNVGLYISYFAGAIQAVIVIGFLLGVAKRFTYGFVFAMHFIGTVTPVSKYLAPYDGLNILFFAAWPMLAACYALFALRDYDTFSLSAFSQKKINRQSKAP